MLARSSGPPSLSPPGWLSPYAVLLVEVGWLVAVIWSCLHVPCWSSDVRKTPGYDGYLEYIGSSPAINAKEALGPAGTR